MKAFTYTEKLEQRDFLEQKIWSFHRNLSQQAKTLPDDMYAALHTLQKLRMGFYEDLNQLFHVAAVIYAYEELKSLKKSYANLEWEWNPAQGGTAFEPDLRGWRNKHIIVSAEIKTSHDTAGTIGKRIKDACHRLEKMEGRKILFVANEKVAGFAKNFVKKEQLSVEIRNLRIRRVNPDEMGRLHQDI